MLLFICVRRSPRRVMPQHDIVDQDVHQGLSYDSSITILQPSRVNPRQATDGKSRHLRHSFFSDHKTTEKDSVVSHSCARYDKTKEQETGQLGELGVAIETCDEGGTKEKDDVKPQSRQRAEPEDGVVVLVAHLLFIGQRICKPALLNGRCHDRKDREHPHHSIILRTEHTGQEDAEQQRQQLLHSVVQPSPQQPVGRTLLQAFLFFFPHVRRRYADLFHFTAWLHLPKHRSHGQ